MQEKPSVQIFILSHNRPELLLETLNSCLLISYPSVEFIVSDNSTDERVFEILQKHPLKTKFKVLRRKHLSFFSDHLNLILNEVTAEYFMVFHDDDLINPETIENYIQIMRAEPKLAACAGNTRVIKNNILISESFFRISQKQMILEASTFMENYFIKSNGHPAFPFYFYRTKRVAHLRMSRLQGGMHSDTSFLYQVMLQGGLCWDPGFVGAYRIHDNNMSKTINLRAINSLYHFFRAKEPALAWLAKDYKSRNLIHFLKGKLFQTPRLLKKKVYRLWFYQGLGYVMSHLPSYFSKFCDRFFRFVFASRNAVR